MFKNRAMQITFPKTQNAAETGTEEITVKTVDPAEIAKIATEYTVKTVVAVGAVIAANKFVGTLCEIAVVAAKAKIK